MDVYLADTRDKPDVWEWSGGGDEVESLLQRIHDGESTLRDPLIARCLPFIRSRAARYSDVRPIDQTDEYSIALLAFNDCIDSYQAYKPGSFFAFATTVIQRRLIDHHRQMRRQSRALPFSSLADEEGMPFEASLYAAAPGALAADVEAAEEIARLEERLCAFGLRLEDMHREVPRHTDSRILCVNVARRLLADPGQTADLFASQRLPVAWLSLGTGLHRKTIERNRRFIILLVLLLDSELEVVKGYIERFYGQNAQ